MVVVGGVPGSHCVISSILKQDHSRCWASPPRLPGHAQKMKKQLFRCKNGLRALREQKTGVPANGGEHLSSLTPTALSSLQKELLNLNQLCKTALTLTSA